MANLIVGDTTHDSTMIWIRGDKFFNRVQVTVESDDEGHHPEQKKENLSSSNDFTAVIPFKDLDASTPYKVSARFTWPRK